MSRIAPVESSRARKRERETTITTTAMRMGEQEEEEEEEENTSAHPTCGLCDLPDVGVDQSPCKRE